MKSTAVQVSVILTTIFGRAHAFVPHQRALSSSSSTPLSPLSSSPTTLSAKKGKIEPIPNEFSRPLRTETILGPRRKDYKIDIQAQDDELTNLAKRFKLSNIQSLRAALTLSRDRSSPHNKGPDGNYVECIQVRGEIAATVVQTCVRTNEDFEVDLEFDLNSIVKACGIQEEEEDLDLGGTGMSAADLEAALTNGGNGGGGGRSQRNPRNKKKKKRRKGVDMRDSNASLNELRMKEIEDLLQDYDLEEDIVEDENIFGHDGMLDVGELVAQTFRLKLDPYPKKPGSEPVSYSITG
jgi:hypothetical protein